jgi:serine/threonine-protein kinase
MNPDRWRVIAPLLDEALDLAPDARHRWLDALHLMAPSIAAELGDLLERDEQADRSGFLVRPPATSLAGLDLGGWTLERPLGHGGMGSVWLARRTDGRFTGTAAVKLLNLALVTEAGQARFRREGSALARLAHPSIARLFDAGVTPSGQPYLVLEHVDGRPIDEYVAERHLTTEARVRLFLQVLDAVGHAHSSLIVHRDLKPSNIFVTADGHVKLLDFGIAKLLDGDAADSALDTSTGGVRPVTWQAPLTAEGGAALTPEFAAPEQVEGNVVTTAADVYASGVLLYVLLSGRHPTASDSRTPAEVLAALIQREPAPLGLGDLDAVLAHALQKRPADRYRTAAAFADDLERWLRHEPVTARRGSLGYRARKFLRRHRGPAAAVATVAIVSIGYVALLTRDRMRLRAALVEAETNANRAERVTDFAVGLFEAREGGSAYADSVSARELLARAVDRAHELARRPLAEAQMLDLIGRIRTRLGDYGAARTALEEALAIRRRELGVEHPDVAATMVDLAAAIRSTDRDIIQAVPILRQALAIRRRVYGDTDPRTTDALYALASTMHMGGDFAGSRPLFDEWLAATRRQPRRLTPEHAEQLNTLSNILQFSGQLAEAERVSRETLGLLIAIYGPSHSRVGSELAHLGGILDMKGDRVGADSATGAAVALLRGVYPAGSLTLANALRNRGYYLGHTGQYGEAVKVWREVAEMLSSKPGKETVPYANAVSQLGNALVGAGRFAEAERTLRALLLLRLSRQTPSNPIIPRARLYLGEALVGQGKYEEAEELLLEVVRGGKDLPLERGSLRRAAQALVRLYDAAARPAEAAKYRVLAAPKPNDTIATRGR